MMEELYILNHSLKDWTKVNDKADDIARELFDSGKIHDPMFDNLYTFEKNYVWKLAKGWVS